jgi:hypothetical protein
MHCLRWVSESKKLLKGQQLEAIIQVYLPTDNTGTIIVHATRRVSDISTGRH